MTMEYIQIILLLVILERVTLLRSRYMLAIDTNGTFKENGYWSIWLYHRGINDEKWSRSGGHRLIHFTKFVIPKIG